MLRSISRLVFPHLFLRLSFDGGADSGGDDGGASGGATASDGGGIGDSGGGGESVTDTGITLSEVTVTAEAENDGFSGGGENDSSPSGGAVGGASSNTFQAFLSLAKQVLGFGASVAGIASGNPLAVASGAVSLAEIANGLQQNGLNLSFDAPTGGFSISGNVAGISGGVVGGENDVSGAGASRGTGIFTVGNSATGRSYAIQLDQNGQIVGTLKEAEKPQTISTHDNSVAAVQESKEDPLVGLLKIAALAGTLYFGIG